MSSGQLGGSTVGLAAVVRRAYLGVPAVLLTLTAIAWLISDLRMSGMDAGPGADLGAFGFYVTTWTVMMAAMMLPSAAPMVLNYRRLQAGARGANTSTALFVVGYLVVWTVSGLLAYAVLKAGQSLGGGLFSWHRAGRWVAAGILAAAAVYEFTPPKEACLSRCRNRIRVLAESWRDGLDGGLRMGLEHGAWCLGCCWLLMIALFALGAMSITWMILITVLIAVEKLLPRRALGVAAVAAVMGLLAVGVAAAPHHVPGLTVPGSPAAMRAMNSMHR